MNERLSHTLTGIAVWWILLLPFDYALFNGIFRFIQIPVYSLLHRADKDLVFESDTYGTYVLVSLSILLGALSTPVIKWACLRMKLRATGLLQTVLAAILFFFLFKYGWDKIVKMQFYLPEPNTVYTPFGKLSKDIAYWSLVGSSYTYTVTLGIIEVLTALLLVFKRTQFLASLLAIGIFGQVVLVNFSFDISVKLLASSLLVFSLIYSFCFRENWKSIFGFPSTILLPVSSKRHRSLKFGFVLLVVAESVYPALWSKNLNDDRFPRPVYHGAYRVIGSKQVKHLFIHRQHYLILQSANDAFKDYRLNPASPEGYTSADGTISCNFAQSRVVIRRDTFRIAPIPYKELPLLQESFHPFADEFH